MSGEARVPTFCFQCNCGPDLLKVVVREGVVVGVEPNFDARSYHPAEGRVCAKAYSLVHKLYNPHRVRSPMVRTNPRKGWDEDPRWREVGWDEALDILCERLRAIRRAGLLNESQHPRLAVTMGSGGTPEGHYGTFPAFMSAFGPIDLTIGSGQGVKCYHSEHVYGELWHRAFIAAPDTPRARLILGFGANTAATRGPSGNWRHAEARVRGCRRIQVEPHLSVTAAVADEWIPIRPKTDSAFLYAMIHVILHEMDWRAAADIEFLKGMTNAPYLVGPGGYYLRSTATGQPLVWDAAAGEASPFDDPSVSPALEGVYRVDGFEAGPDGEVRSYEGAEAAPSFELLLDHVRGYTPEWASAICDIPAETIRRVAREFVREAMVGSTVRLDGEVLPYRPVAIELGKTVNNGWGGLQACWARAVLCLLVGALEVPGGTLGIGARINPPAHDRWASVTPGQDGFMNQALSPTDREGWPAPPRLRSPLTELTPLIGVRGWAQAIAPTPLGWLFMEGSPEGWPQVAPPDVWVVYRCNPLVSYPAPERLAGIIRRFPFVVSIAYMVDETAWFADLVLPESIDLESLQLFRIGGMAHTFESFWEHYGLALRQPVVDPLHETRDMTDIWTGISERLGILDRYNEAINRGALGAPLKGRGYDHRLDLARRYGCEEIWDSVCRAGSRSLPRGEEKDLRWFREHGFYLVRFPRLRHYLHPMMVRWGLRYELPYQERLRRVGEELGRRLHERGIRWWDAQLEEYEALPRCRDFSKVWEEFYGPEHDLWAVTTKSIQYAFGQNVANPLSAEVSAQQMEFSGVAINTETARARGIRDGEEVVIESPRGRVTARAAVREGIRPDTVLFVGQFGHRVTPLARGLGIPNLNQLAALDLRLVDGSGSMADVVRVRVRRAREGSR